MALLDTLSSLESRVWFEVVDVMDVAMPSLENE
jgi:hypothetical protein